MDDDYPFAEKPEGPRKVITARADLELFNDIKFITDLMNEFDKAQGKKGGKKWKMGNVALLAMQALRLRWAKRMGGALPVPEARPEYLRHAKKHFETMRQNALAAKSKK